MRTAASTALPATGLVNRSIAAIRVDLSRVLNLTDPDVLSALAIKPADLLADDTTLSRDIGAAAHAAGYEAILAPSATGAGTVLAVFGANRAPTSLLELASDQTLPAQV
jgi:RES domain-containing protein